MRTTDNKLKEKLQNDIAKGNVHLASGDVADFNAKPRVYEDTKGPAKIKVKKENGDKLMEAADGEPGKIIQNAIGKTAKDEKTAATMGTSETGAFDEVEVLEDERATFLDVLITGDRYIRPFTLFGDKVRGKFRCRTQTESQAIISELNREINDKLIVNALDYSTRLRNMLLAAQVMQFQDEEFPDLQKPLMQTVDSKNDTTIKPGWLNAVDFWQEKHEGLISALYNALQLFEQKYWTMVQHANDQNFWHPAESTSK